MINKIFDVKAEQFPLLNTTMKATKAQAFAIVIKSITVTLWISIQVLYRVHRGIETRTACDRRLRWWSERLLRYLDLSYSVHYRGNIPFEKDKRYIIMSNHSSLYDIPLILLSMPGSIRMLTKKELFDVPIWGRGMKAGEFISIDRHDRRQALKDLEEARRKLESGIVLWIAPEGTRSRTGKLGAFKKGGFMLAMRSRATIIPVGIRGAFEVLPPKTLDFQLGRHAEIHVGEPIDTTLYTNKDRDLLMQQVEAQIRELAGLTDN